VTGLIDVAVVPGDGIGVEVTEAAVEVLAATCSAFDLELATRDYAFGAERFLATGVVLSDDDLAQLRRHDAVLFGACGDPRVPPGVLERGLVVGMRQAFDQYVNLRPVRLLPGVPTPFADLTPERVDLVVVRENSEGLYTGGGGTTHRLRADEVATQLSVSTRSGTERVVRYAFALAAERRGRLTLCHKTNILTFAGDLWERVVAEVGREHPGVAVDYVHVDAMTLHLVQSPERFDVIVTDNLFGDIISDLAATLQGGLGYAPSGNINPERDRPSMFEPVHGSAPDIAGSGKANPVAAVLSAAMMLRHLGHVEPAAVVETAVRTAVSAGLASSTRKTVGAIVDAIRPPLAAAPSGRTS
jgi:3-isopropylmalate dehydrogenase